jgi:hypothetical protein
MSAGIRAYIRQHHVGLVAVFLALSGGVAWASHPGGQNTINSADITNGEVKEADVGPAAVASSEVKNDTIAGGDVAPNTLTAADVKNETLTASELAPNSIPTGRVLDGTLTGGDVANNALKGADVDEASLSGALIPGIATSGLVKSSGVVRADAAEGNVTVKPLLSSGPFSIDGFCGRFGGEITSQVILQTSAANFSIDSDADLGTNFADGATGGAVALAQQSGTPPTKAVDAGDYAAVIPSKVLSGEAIAGVNIMGSDCAWAVTGIG